MTTATPSTSVGQAILALLESDVLTTAGGPLLNLLSAFSNAAGDPLKLTAAWVAFQGAIVGSFPSFEATLSTQIALALTSKLEAAIAAAQANSAAKPVS